MNELNQELVAYIENNIFPLYNRNEEGHGISHIKTVIERSLKFAKEHGVDINMCYTIAAYHDLGHYIDRKRHEIISAEMFMKDENIKKFFNEEQRVIIKEAIEDHRSSSDHVPRSIYGKIVSSADRTIIDIDNSIKRAILYGKRHFPELTEEEQIQRVYTHLKEKYGKNGYGKIYLKDKEFEIALKKLQSLLEDENAFIDKVRKIIKTIDEN